MIRILHIVGSIERAGIESFLMNLYRNIDRDKIQFDFLIYDIPSANSYREEIEALGGSIYIVPPKEKGWIANYQAIRNIVRDNQYEIVWRSTSNAIGGSDLIAAKAGGARSRVLHAHSSHSFGLARILHYTLRPIVNLFASKRVSCGEAAGRWMFGKRSFDIIPNGIDTARFRYNEETRHRYRQKLGVENKTVIGHVGRFERVKNQGFLIDIFSIYHSQNDNTVLLLVGDGKLQQNCLEKVKEYQLEYCVIFVGQRPDIPELLQAMDVFVMPSIYEGFPVTLIEAQASGLPCVVSASISSETDIYGGVCYMDLNSPIDDWCNLIHKQASKRYSDGAEKVAHANYDIKEIADSIMEMIRM